MVLTFLEAALIHFSKYHGLGNDYLVIEPEQFFGLPSAEQVRKICDRHYGVGSDGILLGPSTSQEADFLLRIYNPDGSEAEKSGNGLRIFARYLWDHGMLSKSTNNETSTIFSILTSGSKVQAQVLKGGQVVLIWMGKASFNSRDIPMSGPERQVVGEWMKIGDRDLQYCAVSLGNPHCVVICLEISEKLARSLGPLIEKDARFLKRTNVQFMRAISKDRIQIEIWERGAGYTLASGSSSCAAAAAAFKLGLCQSELTVINPGGCLEVAIERDWSITLTGPVEKVFEGEIDASIN